MEAKEAQVHNEGQEQAVGGGGINAIETAAAIVKDAAAIVEVAALVSEMIDMVIALNYESDGEDDFEWLLPEHVHSSSSSSSSSAGASASAGAADATSSGTGVGVSGIKYVPGEVVLLGDSDDERPRDVREEALARKRRRLSNNNGISSSQGTADAKVSIPTEGVVDLT
mmetsp:Transcript_35211/g.75955  ORF Transcript_35211/g.75955 Transcript_35211/m.75955 type:complete len:169 (-) Transcript_35211:73-579(-)